MKDKVECIAISDLHGRTALYEKLFKLISNEVPKAVFIAGDITGGYFRTHLGEKLEEFITQYLGDKLRKLKVELKEDYPSIFVILGNDDPRYLESSCLQIDNEKLWHYVHNRCLEWSGFKVCGYSYVPPSPFQLKDWEKYDVSRYVDVGSIPPDAGFRTVDVEPMELKWGTIKRDLEQLFDDQNLSRHICLFHSPPYKTKLDRADLDDRTIDHAPMDVHVGSIAIKVFIERYQPFLTIHGHVHESTSITGSWDDKLGKTIMLNPAHYKPELSVIRFDLEQPFLNNRIII